MDASHPVSGVAFSRWFEGFHEFRILNRYRDFPNDFGSRFLIAQKLIGSPALLNPFDVVIVFLRLSFHNLGSYASTKLCRTDNHGTPLVYQEFEKVLQYP